MPGSRQSPSEAVASLWMLSTLFCLWSQNLQVKKSKDSSPIQFNKCTCVWSLFFRSHKSNGWNAYTRKPNWPKPEANSLKRLCPVKGSSMGILITGPCRSEQKPCSDRDLGPSAKMSNTVSCCGLEVSPEGTYFVFQQVRKLATGATQRFVSLDSRGG